MSTIAEDSAFVEMMAAAFERCGIDIYCIRTDYWRLCELAGCNAASAEGIHAGTTRLSLTNGRTLVAHARKRLIDRITDRLEA